MSNANYDPLNLGDMAAEAERVQRDPNAGSGFLDNFVKLPKGDGFIIMRFLPPAPGTSFYMATRTHKLAEKTYHCPRTLQKTNNGMFWLAPEEGEDCPVCRYYRAEWQKSMKIGDEKARNARQNQLRAIKPVERYYYNVIVRECVDPKTNKMSTDVGPLIFSCGKTVHAKIITAIVGNVKAGKKKKGNIADLTAKEGRDFRLVKTTTRGSGGFEYPDYAESEFEETSVAGTPEQIEKWLANLHDLTKLRTVKEWAVLDHALKVHNGVIEGDDDDFDTSVYEPGHGDSSMLADDETPIQKSSPPVSKTKEQAPASKPIVKQEKKEPSKSKAVEDEILVDPEFQAELDALEDQK